MFEVHNIYIKVYSDKYVTYEMLFKTKTYSLKKGLKNYCI